MSEEKKNPAQEDTKLNLDQLDMVSGGDDNEASRDEWGGSGSPGSLIDKESGLRCPV